MIVPGMLFAPTDPICRDEWYRDKWHWADHFSLLKALKIYGLICKIWGWRKKCLMCPIFKKGNKANCSTYRGITLLSCVYKVFSNVLMKRLNSYAEEILNEYQSGFRRGRSTVDL